MSEHSDSNETGTADELQRRAFLKWASIALGGAALGVYARDEIENPLKHYPAREWEKVYREQYAYDSTAQFGFAPDEVHAASARGIFRKNTLMRLEDAYAQSHQGPRLTAQAYAFPRFLYGPHRLKFPLVRKGWKQWADDGFAVLTPALRAKYKFDQRDSDEFVRTSWDDALKCAVHGLGVVAKTYSGAAGQKLLLEEGFDIKAVNATRSAGTRCCKFAARPDGSLLLARCALERLANALAYLDIKTRRVGYDTAFGGRTWIGAADSGHRHVHGYRSGRTDFSSLRFSRLIVQAGANLFETRPADAHWLTEAAERGAKVVSISPECNAAASKSDYWIPIRPSTDAALWLGIAKLIIEKNAYDEKFVLERTDLPLPIRTDNLRRPDGAARARPAAALDRKWIVKTLAGADVEVQTVWRALREHLKAYDLDKVSEITGAPKGLLEQLAHELATIKPAAICVGADASARAAYLPLLLTGQLGGDGAGCFATDGDSLEWLAGPGAIGLWALSATERADGGEPTPTKALICCGTDPADGSSDAASQLTHALPKTDMLVAIDTQMTATAQFADIVLPANTWAEHEALEVSLAAPFLQISKGALKPLYETRDPARIVSEIGALVAKECGNACHPELWKLFLENDRVGCVQRLLDSCPATKGLDLANVLNGKYGVPGMALLKKASPLVEHIRDNLPFPTATGRLEIFCDDPGENLVGCNPLQPKDDEFHLLTRPSRHRAGALGANIDWQLILDSDFGDPYRPDKRTPGVGEAQIEPNPAAARKLGLQHGDYVWVGNTENAEQLMIRLKINPAVPSGAALLKRGWNPATEKTIAAQQSRADGMALTADGYQASARFGAFGCGSLVRIKKAEDGRRATKRAVPGNESEAMRKYLAGGFIADE